MGILLALLLPSCGAVPPPPTRALPPAVWESILFKGVGNTKGIDDVTLASGIKPLRETGLKNGDFEIRFWRGAFAMEGVVLRRVRGDWSAIHIIPEYVGDDIKATLLELPSPKSGWDTFWQKIVDLGVLNLTDPLDRECHLNGIDMPLMVVEINENGSYRNYQHTLRAPKCSGSRQMDIVSETIGKEFHNGVDLCLRAEWFACAEFLERHRLKEEGKLE